MELPQDFIEKMKKMLGDEFDAFLYSYSHDRYQSLRFNTLKEGMDAEQMAAILEELKDCKEELTEESTEESEDDPSHLEAGFVPVPWANDSYYYDGHIKPGKHAFHEMGLYYIQEPSAMSAAALLAPEPGMRVLDLCAAPGGKTTQLSSYLGNKGLLVANEIHPVRAKILSSNVERFGLTNTVVTNEDSKHLASYFPSYFHAILVDAPCSGEGMFRKNPDSLKEWSKEQVLLCASRQQEILDNAASMLMPGGKMVYSTCTFSREENEETILEFLKLHEEFSLVDISCPWFKETELKGAFRLWPHKLHGEGHFVAVMEKKGILPDYDTKDENSKEASLTERKTKKNASKKSPSKGQLDEVREKALRSFLEESLSKEWGDYIMAGKLVLLGEQLYRLPMADFPMRGLKLMRPGLHIGEFKKNRFEPSHALALALGEKDVCNYWNLDKKDDRVRAYYRGESLMISECQAKGWCLVGYYHFPMGWGKAASGQIKNHYPKGLRKEVWN